MADQLDIFNAAQDGLDMDEKCVWAAIEGHRGKDRAVKVDVVARLTGISGKRVRQIVAHLVNEHGKLIGSSTCNPPGFYIIVDKEELTKQIESLRHRGIMCLKRAAKLGKSSLEEVYKQGKLALDEH